MKLQLLIDGKLVDEIPVDFTLITMPGYLQNKRQLLEEKHRLLLLQSQSMPVCYVDNVPSKINGTISNK